jgi:hypothetical protein
MSKLPKRLPKLPIKLHVQKSSHNISVCVSASYLPNFINAGVDLKKLGQ